MSFWEEKFCFQDLLTYKSLAPFSEGGLEPKHMWLKDSRKVCFWKDWAPLEGLYMDRDDCTERHLFVTFVYCSGFKGCYPSSSNSLTGALFFYVCFFIGLFCLFSYVSSISMVIAVRSSWYTDQCGVEAQSVCTPKGKEKSRIEPPICEL